MLRPPRSEDTEHRPHRRPRRPLHSGLRQFRSLFGNAHRTHHRTLSIPASRWPGRTDSHTRLRGIQGVNAVGLPPEHPTLPSSLRKTGYGTTLVGKWHLGSLPNFGPLKSGYDHFYGFRVGAVDYFNHTTGGADEDLWDEDVLVHESGYLTTLFGDRAVRVVNGYAKS